MFLKKCVRKKSGKRHTYWSLVESVRTAKGSRHRVVAYLGELKASEKSGWAQLGRHRKGEAKAKRPERSLIDPPQHAAPRDDEPALVKLSGIKLERTRDFGDVWLALGLWRMLGLDTLLEQLMPAGLEQVPWHVMAANASGLGDAPRTLLAEFDKIKNADVVLPVIKQNSDPVSSAIHKHVRLRCVTEADEAQRVLLYRLGLALPHRLRHLETLSDPPISSQLFAMQM